MQHNQSFITLKGHKGNFQNNPKYRLINPAKTEKGIVSIHYTDQINKSIREKLNVNKWRNTQVVMTLFKNIKSKSSSSFIKVDIVDFYRSILKELSLKAISLAKSVIPIQDKFIETILKRFYSIKAMCTLKKIILIST